MAGSIMNDLSLQFYRIIAATWRRRYALLTPVLIMPIIGFFISSFSPQQYSAHTSMLIQETAKMNPFLQDFAVSAMLKERMTTIETLLHSRHILATVAEQRDFIDDSTPAAIRDSEIEKLSSSLSVSMSGKDLIRIDYKSDKAQGMKETLEAVSNQFIEQVLAPERSSMIDSSSFLLQQLEQRREGLEQSETKLANFKDQYASVLPELHNSNITQLVRLKQKLSEKQADIAGARKSLGGLDAQLSKTNPVIGRLEQQIISLKGDLAILRSRYTDNHSKILAALRKLTSLEQERQNNLKLSQQTIDTTKLWQIASSVKTSKGNNSEQPLLISQLENLQSSRNRVEQLDEEIKSLQKMISALQQKASSVGNLERQLIKLERDLKVKRELYEELLNRYEMAQITSSLSLFEQSKRVKIIDQAYTPTSTSNLPLTLFMAAGLAGGVFLGIGLALLLEFSDNSLRYRDQLESITGLPVLGRISAIQQRESL